VKEYLVILPPSGGGFQEGLEKGGVNKVPFDLSKVGRRREFRFTIIQTLGAKESRGHSNTQKTEQEKYRGNTFISHRSGHRGHTWLEREK